jgi:hypothetical protein
VGMGNKGKWDGVSDFKNDILRTFVNVTMYPHDNNNMIRYIKRRIVSIMN